MLVQTRDFAVTSKSYLQSVQDQHWAWRPNRPVGQARGDPQTSLTTGLCVATEMRAPRRLPPTKLCILPPRQRLRAGIGHACLASKIAPGYMLDAALSRRRWIALSRDKSASCTICMLLRIIATSSYATISRGGPPASRYVPTQAVEDRDSQVTKDFNAEATRLRKAIGKLHSRADEHSRHFEGTRREFKQIYDDMSADMDKVDHGHSALAARVKELAAHDQQRQSSEVGMMYFARSVQAKIDELRRGFDDLVTQGGLLDVTFEQPASKEGPTTSE